MLNPCVGRVPRAREWHTDVASLDEYQPAVEDDETPSNARLFSSLERQTLIYSILEAKPSSGGAGIDLPEIVVTDKHWRVPMKRADEQARDPLIATDYPLIDAEREEDELLRLAAIPPPPAHASDNSGVLQPSAPRPIFDHVFPTHDAVEREALSSSWLRRFRPLRYEPPPLMLLRTYFGEK
eukprot:5197781-Prymnesium_polylepis.1